MKLSLFLLSYKQLRSKGIKVFDIVALLLRNNIIQIAVISVILYYIITTIVPKFGFLLPIFAGFGFILVILFTSRIKETLLFIFFLRFTIDLFWNIRFFGFNPLDVTGGVIFVIFLVNLFYKKVNFLQYKNAKIVLLFILSQIVTIVFGIIQMLSVGERISFIYSAKLLIKSLSPFLFYFITSIYLRNKNDIRKFVYAWVLGCIIPSVSMIYAIIVGYGFGRVSYGAVRFAGFYHESAGPGIISAVLIFLVFLILETEKLKFPKVAGIFSLLVINFYTLYLSFSRVFVIPIIIGIVSWFVVQKRLLLSLLSIFLVVFAFLKLPLAQERFEVERQFIEGEAYTSQIMTGRPVLYEKAVEIFLSYNFAQKIIGKGPAATFGAHNEYLYMLLKSGIFGLIIYILLFIQIIKAIIKRYIFEKDKFLKTFNLVTLILVAALPLQAMSGHPLNWMNLQWFIWSAVGIALNYDASANK